MFLRLTELYPWNYNPDTCQGQLILSISLWDTLYDMFFKECKQIDDMGHPVYCTFVYTWSAFERWKRILRKFLCKEKSLLSRYSKYVYLHITSLYYIAKLHTNAQGHNFFFRLPLVKKLGTYLVTYP